MASVLISMGSNIEPDRHLVEAVRVLRSRVSVRAVSRVFETEPVGSPAGPRFLNAALEVDSEMPPFDLKFEVLRPVEDSLGRIRTADLDAPRTLDLDISLYGNLVQSNPRAGLEIPDPEVLSRAHVAVPLADIAPARCHPVTGSSLEAIAFRLAEKARIRTYLQLDLRVLLHGQVSGEAQIT